MHRHYIQLAANQFYSSLQYLYPSPFFSKMSKWNNPDSTPRDWDQVCERRLEPDVDWISHLSYFAFIAKPDTHNFMHTGHVG